MHTPASLLLILVAADTASSFLASHALQLQNPAVAAANTCIPQERDALLAFKQGITGDPAGRLASWREGEEDCCRWRGVRCSNQTGHVVGLNLRNDYIGDDTTLVGQISPSLLSLHHLMHLDLSLNNFSGPTGRVPEFLGLLKNLRYLNLSGTSFYGRVPPQLGNLSKLHYLDLSPTDFNFLDGPSLYSTDITWLSNLPLLHLNMDYVNLSRIVDWAHVVNMVPSLMVLHLSGCSLTSANQSLPHLNLTDLKELSLSDNDFDHPVASCWFWNLTSLKHLEFEETFVYGQIPDALGGMTSLKVLDFSFTHGSIDIMTANMTNLCNLESLDFSSSNLDGNLTELLGRLPQCSPNKLKELHLNSNNFSGVLPNWIGRWTSLLILDLSNNKIAGHVPSEISMLSNLQTLNLRDNGISGTLPTTNLKNMTSLEVLYLNSNQLTGQIPQLPTNLCLLDISGNYLSGPLPSNFGTPNLSSLFLFSNHITGHIPQSICELDMYAMNLANNHLEGEFPQCFEPKMARVLILGNNMLSGKLEPILKTYTELQILDLAWNKFTGSIPSSITDLSWLFHLNLAGNSISGALPHHLSNLTMMKINIDSLPASFVYAVGYYNIEVNMSVTMNGQERYYYVAKYNMVSIDLSSNNLTGGIPEGIASLYGVINLNLSRNYLTGKIPEKIGAMHSLESVDLSRNNFCGEIPQSLSNLTFLGSLDLSHNNLRGRIPSGGQLDTLYMQNPLMYDGNIGLCGYPLHKNCSDNSEPNHGEHKEVEKDSILSSFSFGLGIGFVVGLWVVFCVILLNKSWRIAYFRLFDKAFDKVFVFVFVTWARWAKKKATH